MILWTDHLEIDSYVFPCEPEPTGAAAEDPEGIFVLWARKWRFSKEMTRKWKQEGVIWFVGNDCSWLSPEGRSSLLSFFSFHFTTSCFLTFFFYLFSIFCAPVWFLWFLSSSPRSVSSCWWLGIINWFSQSPGCKQQIKTVSLSLSFFIFLLLLLFLSSSLPLFLCLSLSQRRKKTWKIIVVGENQIRSGFGHFQRLPHGGQRGFFYESFADFHLYLFFRHSCGSISCLKHTCDCWIGFGWRSIGIY